MDDLDDLLKEPFDQNHGDYLEYLTLKSILNTQLLSEILKRQIKLESMVRGIESDESEIQDEFEEITKEFKENATQRKNDIIASFYLKRGERLPPAS